MWTARSNRKSFADITPYVFYLPLIVLLVGFSANKCGLRDVKLIYRASFRRENGTVTSKSIGNTGDGAEQKRAHKFKLLVLDLESAYASQHLQIYAYIVVDARPASIKYDSKGSVAGVETALKLYMKRYFGFLKKSGNHVFFDLPDFDDDKHSPKIDYSLTPMAKRIQEKGHEITFFGHSLDNVNDYLNKQWRTSMSNCRPDREDVLLWSLAQIRSSWLPTASVVGDLKFHIRFGAPKVKAICGQEVLLTFDLDKIGFFDTNDFK